MVLLWFICIPCTCTHTQPFGCLLSRGLVWNESYGSWVMLLFGYMLPCQGFLSRCNKPLNEDDLISLDLHLFFNHQLHIRILIFPTTHQSVLSKVMLVLCMGVTYMGVWMLVFSQIPFIFHHVSLNKYGCVVFPTPQPRREDCNSVRPEDWNPRIPVGISPVSK